MNWHEFFLAGCEWAKSKSKDPSTQTGCVIVSPANRVRSIGFNGFPCRVRDLPERYADRPLKYRLIVHCDENAIFSAARDGISVQGCTMYLTGPPCGDCMKGIAQAGIDRVIWPKDNGFEQDPELAARWKDSIADSHLVADEAGIGFYRYNHETKGLEWANKGATLPGGATGDEHLVEKEK